MVTTTTITINNGGFPQVNYAFAVTIPFITGQMNADYSDIRFKVTGSSTVLACWRRSYTASSTAVFLVNIPALPTGTTSLDLSYGDAALLTTSSFALTFPYFTEDFEAGNTAFQSAWTNTGSNAPYTTTYLDASGATVTGGTDYNQRTRWAAATYSGVEGAATTTTPISNTYDMVLQGNYGGMTLDPPGAENAWTSKSSRQFTLPAGDYRLEFSAQGLMGHPGYDMLRVTLTSVTDATVIREWKRGGVANSTTLASGLSATYSAVGTYTGDFTLTAQKTLRFEGAAHNGGWAGTLILDQIFVRTYPVIQPTATGASITPVTGSPTSRYVRGITVVNPGPALSNYAIDVTVPFVSGQMNADYSDIRFMLAGSTAPLGCWRRSYTASSTAVFWVNIPSLPAGTTYLDLASGDATLLTTSSFAQAFPSFSEDFEGGVVTVTGAGGAPREASLSTWTFSGSSTSPDPVNYPNLNGYLPYRVIANLAPGPYGTAIRGTWNLWLSGNFGLTDSADDPWIGRGSRQFDLPAGSYRLEFTSRAYTSSAGNVVRFTVTNVTSNQLIQEWKNGQGASTLVVGDWASTGGGATWGAITSYAGDFTLAVAARVQVEGAAQRLAASSTGFPSAQLDIDDIFVRGYPASGTSPPTVTLESVAHASTRGASTLASRADHTHVVDGRQAGLTGTVTDITPTGTAAITASAGVSALLARSDHVHKTPATWPINILVNGSAPGSQPASTARPSLRITPQLTQVWYRDYAVADRTVIGFTQPAVAAQGPVSMPRYATTTLSATAAAISLTGVDAYGASQRLGTQTMATGTAAVPGTPVGSQLLTNGVLQEQYVTNSTTGAYTAGPAPAPLPTIDGYARYANDQVIMGVGGQIDLDPYPNGALGTLTVNDVQVGGLGVGTDYAPYQVVPLEIGMVIGADSPNYEKFRITAMAPTVVSGVTLTGTGGVGTYRVACVSSVTVYGTPIYPGTSTASSATWIYNRFGVTNSATKLALAPALVVLTPPGSTAIRIGDRVVQTQYSYALVGGNYVAYYPEYTITAMAPSIDPTTPLVSGTMASYTGAGAAGTYGVSVRYASYADMTSGRNNLARRTYTFYTSVVAVTPTIAYVLPGNWPGFQYSTMVLRALLATTGSPSSGKVWLTLNADRGTGTYRAAGIRENSAGRGYWQKTGSASDFNVTGSGVQLGETGDQYDPAYVEVVLTSRPYQAAPVAATAAGGGSISGTTFTDTTHGSGMFAVGQVLTGTNVVKGTWIRALLTGTGSNSTGTYTVSQSQNVTSQTISGSAVTSWSNQAIGIQSTVIRGGTATASASRYASAGSWNSGGDMLQSIGLETDATFASGSTVSLFGYVGRDEVLPTLTLVSYSLPVPVKAGVVFTITATFSEQMIASPTIAISGANTLAAFPMTLGTLLTDGTQTWTYAYTVGSGNGTNTLTIAGNDLYGNALAGTVTAPFVSDTIAPVVALTYAITSSVPADVAAAASLTYASSLPRPVRVGDVVMVKAILTEATGLASALVLTGGNGFTSIVAYTAATSVGTTYWRYNTITAGQNATITLAVTAPDTAGNTAVISGTATFVVDTTAPATATTLVFTPAGGVIGTTNTLNNTNTNFTVTATVGADFGSLGGTAELLVGGVSFASPVIAVLASGAVSASLTPGFTTTAAVQAAMPSGTRSLTIRLTDEAGNSTTSSALSVVVNYTPLVVGTTITGDYAFPFSIGEGNSVNYQVAVTGVSTGTTLYWVMRATSGGTAQDFTDSKLSDSYLLASTGTNTIIRTWANDQTTEGNETWYLEIRTGSPTGTLLGTSGAVTILDSSPAPTATITVNNATINEGGSVIYHITLVGVAGVYSTLYWTMATTNAGATALASDFSDGLGLSGSFSVPNSFISQDITRTWANDVTTEGPETWVMQIRTVSITGTVIGTSSQTVVADTSTAATATVTRNNATINEGGTVTYQITVTGIAANTTVWWAMRLTSAGTASASDFNDGWGLTGTYIVANGFVNTLSRTWAQDLTTEGAETWVMDIITGSDFGPVIGTSPETIVADTSVLPAATIGVSPSSINEGATVTFTITITANAGVAGITLYWVMRCTSGTGLAADFTPSGLSGSYTVSPGLVDTVTRTWANDVTTDGAETWVMDIRTGSITGTLIGTSAVVTVADTSQGPSATVSPTGITINEGTTRTYTITTLNVAQNTNVYWIWRATQGTLNPGNFDTGDQGDFASKQFSGSFVCPANGIGTATVAWRNDLVTEGTEIYVLDVKLGSTLGTLIGSGGITTVLDTSHP